MEGLYAMGVAPICCNNVKSDSYLVMLDAFIFFSGGKS